MCRAAIGLIVCLALTLGACANAGSAQSTAPASATGPSGPAVSAATAAPTGPASQSAPSITSLAASPTANASLEPLKLMWQKGGSPQAAPGTYWPAIDPLTGDVWVASPFDNKFWILTPDGKYLESWGTPGSGPGQLALTTRDVHPDGVGAIAFAPDGSFYIADNGNYRVEKFDPNRHFVLAWGSFGTGDGQFGSPKGIATDGKTVYVADDPRGDMQAFDPNGHFLREFVFPGVLFSLTPDGHLIAGDNHSGDLAVMDGSGRVVAKYAQDFASYGPDPAQAGSPTGASQAVEDRTGRIFVGLVNDAGPVGLLELDRQGHLVHRWSTGAETMVLSRDGSSLYMASMGVPGTGWSFIRKYALP